jgi:protein with PEP-CTERM/exosortase system signal
MKKSTKLLLVIGSIGFVSFIAYPVEADTITFDLTTGNSAISGYPGPYASVLVNRTSTTTATITFTSLTNSGRIYLFGDGSSVGVNVNAASWTLGPITGSNAGAGFSPASYSNAGSQNVNGFGIFNQVIDSGDGFTHSSDTISFSLTDTSGSWASAMAVLLANSTGSLAEAHVFVTDFPADASNGAIATGFASNGADTVPDSGTTVALLGIALVGIGSLRSKFSRN